MNDLICPKCDIRLDRKYGLPGVVVTCPNCQEDYIICLGKLVSRGEFHAEADKWHS